MFFFRVLAGDADRWLCKRGSRVLAEFDDLPSALDRANIEATLHRPSQVLYHDLLGEVTVLANYRATA